MYASMINLAKQLEMFTMRTNTWNMCAWMLCTWINRSSPLIFLATSNLRSHRSEHASKMRMPGKMWNCALLNFAWGNQPSGLKIWSKVHTSHEINRLLLHQYVRIDGQQSHACNHDKSRLWVSKRTHLEVNRMCDTESDPLHMTRCPRMASRWHQDGIKMESRWHQDEI